jgi:hypothetical protein
MLPEKGKRTALQVAQDLVMHHNGSERTPVMAVFCIYAVNTKQRVIAQVHSTVSIASHVKKLYILASSTSVCIAHVVVWFPYAHDINGVLCILAVRVSSGVTLPNSESACCHGIFRMRMHTRTLNQRVELSRF